MLCRATLLQIRKFQPKLVAIKDAGKVKQLQELIKDVPQQPEILVGDEGAVEVRRVGVAVGGGGCRWGGVGWVEGHAFGAASLFCAWFVQGAKRGGRCAAAAGADQGC